MQRRKLISEKCDLFLDALSHRFNLSALLVCEPNLCASSRHDSQERLNIRAASDANANDKVRRETSAQLLKTADPLLFDALFIFPGIRPSWHPAACARGQVECAGCNRAEALLDRL